MRTFLGLLLFITLALSAGAPAAAETVQDRVVRELRSQGFDQISGRRTLLGNLRFVAEAHGVRREIVVNPRTGEILRDYVKPASAGGSGPERSGDRDRSDRGGASGGNPRDDSSDAAGDSRDDGSDDESDDGASDDGGSDGAGDSDEGDRDDDGRDEDDGQDDDDERDEDEGDDRDEDD